MVIVVDVVELEVVLVDVEVVVELVGVLVDVVVEHSVDVEVI